MSEDSDDHAGIIDNLINNLKHLPAATDAGAPSESFLHPHRKHRLFGRERPIHQLLGGSCAADVLLWRNKRISAGVLTGATLTWVVFQWIGCHFVSVLSLLLLGLLAILFAWSNVAAFLHRSPPPVRPLQLSDDLIEDIASTLKNEINRLLLVLHDIAMGKDFKLFLEVSAGLWVLSVVGGCFDFLTLIYIGVVAAHTIPVIYEKYEDVIEKYSEKAFHELQQQYRKFDANVLSKIPRGPTKVKKLD